MNCTDPAFSLVRTTTSWSKRIEALFGGGVAVEAVMPLPDGVVLHPIEERAVHRAVPKRRGEFAAGRWCARRALARLGMEDVVLPAGADRAPVWPAGIVGSITHTDAFCAAAVAHCTVVRALGIDAEPDEPLPTELWGPICTPAERRRLEDCPPLAGGRLARLLFSAKECFYKLQYPLTRRFLDFQDVRVDLDPCSGSFTVVLRREAGEGFSTGTSFTGRYLVHRGLLVTVMAVRG